MSGPVNADTYDRMVAQDKEWLMSHTDDCLERQHILLVMDHSASEYRAGRERLNHSGTPAAEAGDAVERAFTSAIQSYRDGGNPGGRSAIQHGLQAALAAAWPKLCEQALERDGLVARVAELIAERDALRARVAELIRERDAAFALSGCECAAEECCVNQVAAISRADKAEAELQRLRADAQRYRWLKSGGTTAAKGLAIYALDRWDETIDYAMQGHTS